MGQGGEQDFRFAGFQEPPRMKEEAPAPGAASILPVACQRMSVEGSLGADLMGSSGFDLRADKAVCSAGDKGPDSCDCLFRKILPPASLYRYVQRLCGPFMYTAYAALPVPFKILLPKLFIPDKTLHDGKVLFNQQPFPKRRAEGPCPRKACRKGDDAA